MFSDIFAAENRGEQKWRVNLDPEQIQQSYIDRLFTAFHVANRHIQQEMSLALKDMKLTGPQFFILYLLSTSEDMKSTELAEKLDVKPSAITVMIDRLLKNDLVLRQRDERDRRIVKLQLTSLGREIFEKAKRKRRGYRSACHDLRKAGHSNREQYRRIRREHICQYNQESTGV